MLAATLFFYFLSRLELLLAGASIIAFVSGTNPVEAVQGGAARLIGTLVGSVLGGFATSLSDSAEDRILAICIITFFLSFPRPGHSFGMICTYCNFIAITALTRFRMSPQTIIDRIQQNTFAILIYCFISIVIYPLSPGKVLRKKRIAVLSGISEAIKQTMSMLHEVA
uniref:Aluminum-activated malate transporter 12 n=1 Tax=Lygus hesperus TaxID=30085 RepID=A0A0A9Y9C0_LYGHE